MPVEQGKLFLGGISPTTTSEGILEYFMQFGTITDAVAMKDKDGRSRCFGFVTFEDPSILDAILSMPHELDGKILDVKPTVPRELMPAPLPRQVIAGKGGFGVSFGQMLSKGDYGGCFQQTLGVERGETRFVGGRENLVGAQFLGGHPTSDGDFGKLFLGGINPATTTEDIVDYFSKYGTVVDAVAMKAVDGRPRGFGFVTFEDPSVVDAVLMQQHELLGRVMDVKAAVARDAMGALPLAQFQQELPPIVPQPILYKPNKGGKGPAAGPATDKVFVGGLHLALTDQEFIEYFQRYGNIIDSVVMKDKETGSSRGFGFVQFDNTQSVDMVMEDYDKHNIGGKWAEVKRSIPKEQMPVGKGKFGNPLSQLLGCLGKGLFGDYGGGKCGGLPSQGVLAGVGNGCFGKGAFAQKGVFRPAPY